MKKHTYYLLIGLFSMILLTACGGGESKNTEDKTDTTTATADNTKGESNSSDTANTDGNTDSNTAKDTTATTGSEDGTAQDDTAASDTFVEGTFTGLEQGDLFYFNLKDANGKDWSFTVMKTDDTYEKISKDEAAYKGKKIKVYYKKESKFVEQAGGNVEMMSYKKAEILEK